MARGRPGYQEEYRRQRPAVTARIDAKTRARLEELAAAEGKKVGVYVRDHIEALVDSARTPATETDRVT